MLGFFRKIRQQLANDNQFLKYSRYAIGEIVLVMVGILFALSVNNWNESRKDSNYVGLMLKEIYYDLSSDYELIYMAVEPRLKRMQEGVGKIKDFMVQKEFSSDTVFMQNYRWMNGGFSLTQRTGAFQSLKLGGLDKIKNDSLRTQLLDFYESSLPRSLGFITQNDAFIQEQVKILEKDLFKFQFKTQNDVVAQVKVPINKAIISHQSLHTVFDLKMRDIRHKSYRLKALKRNYYYVIETIERELEQREIPFKYLDTLSFEKDY